MATAARLPHSRMLIAHGASLDTRNSLAPMTAARDGDEKVVAILLKRARTRDCAAKSRQNARDIARAAGRTAIAEMMKSNVIVGRSARRATRSYSACLINSVFAIRPPSIAVVITRAGVFLEQIFAILSSRCPAGENSLVKRIRNWGRKMWNCARFVALAMSASAGMLSSALAADLDRPPPAPDHDYAPRHIWDRLYFGCLVGGAHGVWTVNFFRHNNHGHAEEGFDGIEGGGWVGHNYLMSPNFVVGIETDLGPNNALKLQVINAVVDRATAKDLLEAIERKAALPHLTYWIEPVETFGRMQRASAARQPNDAALNASETREEA